ncbi:MAG: NF038129 family PEP-CTERM protein [Bryobacterales bacterium]|nr:NF038129 family PEP-CTERM protein [Bryobacterales bacterium]
MRRLCISLCVVLLSLMVMVTPSTAGIIIYDVQVNTSAPGVPGTSGSFEFQLSAGIPGDPLITATITNFTTSGTLVGAPTNAGNVSGALPGTVSIDNGNVNFAVASMLQQITYGMGFSFRLTIDTVAVDPGPPLTSLPLLALYLYDNSLQPILTTDIFGSVLTWETDADRNPIVSTFPANALGAPSVITISDVPEPAAVSFVLVGMAMILARKRFLP